MATLPQRQYKSHPAPICCLSGRTRPTEFAILWAVMEAIGLFGDLAPISPGHCRLKPLCGAGLRMTIGLSSAIPIPF